MTTSTSRIRAFLAALLLSLCFGAACLKIPALSTAISKIGNINLITYAMTILLFCGLCFLFCVISSLKKGASDMASGRAAILAALLMASNFVFLAVMYLRESEVAGSFAARYIWHNMPTPLVFASILCVSLWALMLIRKSRLRASSASCYLLYGLLTALSIYDYYTPEIFLRDNVERYHSNAYFNSVYNVLHGCAYTENATSIYGHYALFYKLPLKLLGGDHVDFILLNACVGGLCFFAMFLALHLIVKNSLLRILGAVAMTFPILSMRRGIYWQLWPHRILFMSLMLCYTAFCVHFKKLGGKYIFLGYVLSSLAILWNTESGLFCAASWTAFHLVRLFCDRSKTVLSTVGGTLLHAGGCILSFLGAWGIVELYNISCGAGPQGVREFLYPLLSSRYMTDVLRLDLPDYPAAYIPVACLLFLGVAWGISHLRFVKRSETTVPLLPCYAFSTSVLGLGQLSYFMNRAAYHNLEICHLPCVLLLCLMSARGISFIKKFRFRNLKKYPSYSILHGAFTVTALTVLVTLTAGNLIQYGYNTILRQPFHNRQEAVDFAANVAANIPENTYGFGIGVSEIYSMLRWDTGCYTMDFADIGLLPQAADHIIEDIRQKDLPGFLAGEGSMTSLKKYCTASLVSWLLKNYELEQSFEFKGMVVEYYVKK